MYRKLTLVLVSIGFLCAANRTKSDGIKKYPKYLFEAPNNNASSEFKFPPNFLFGVASSAHQFEGAWNVGGKSESNWDYLVHHHPDIIADRSNGDVACDSYHNMDVDISLLKQLKVGFYRFSVSWTRLLPSGYADEPSADGIRYYNELIDKLLANNIIPLVTIYHWDMPQKFQKAGGWVNKWMIKNVVDYARFCFKTFGDRVKHWITFNEPYAISYVAYGGVLTTRKNNTAPYIVGHNLLVAHARIYHMYKREFRKQNGKLGIVIDTKWFEPLTKSKKDKEISERVLRMFFGWFANPIFSSKGGYPDVMVKRIAELSIKEGLKKSRLPSFSKKRIARIKGTADFLGINHYSSLYVTEGKSNESADDMNAVISVDERWPKTGSSYFYVVPFGMRKILNWVKREYGNVPVLITENGYAGSQCDSLDDERAPSYFNLYLHEVLAAIKVDKCNVQGYGAWSFLDNFEWNRGYTLRFGMYHVDFKDPKRARTPRKSAFTFQNIIVTRKVNVSFIPDKFLH